MRFTMASPLAHYSSAMIVLNQIFSKRVRRIAFMFAFTAEGNKSLLTIALVFFSLLSLNSASVAQQTVSPDGSQQEYFEKFVRPILAEHCWSCHSGQAGESKGSLRLDHSTFLLKGGDSGPALVAGDPAGSLLFQAVSYDGYEMPPDGKIAMEKIDILKTWIANGAYWPEEPLPESKETEEAFDLQARKEAFWVWKGIADTPVPQVRDEEQAEGASVSSNLERIWAGNSIDAYVLQSLRRAGLKPNEQADRPTLIRRLYLDLIGVPPTPEEVSQFANSTDPEWYASLLDSLLANPQFGVRWGRHWLDLVRFAQSRGHEFDEDIPSAEPYRDYVIRALNEDVPYSDFLVEHLAGDLMSAPRTHPTLGWSESVLGTGFWHFGDWVHSPVDARKDETDRLDNMVDVFSKTFLGMTVACARCHDHKFDAISQEDYYALFGFLRSSDYRLVRFETDLQHRKIAALREARFLSIQDDANKALKRLVELVPPVEGIDNAGDPRAKWLLESAAKIAQHRNLTASLVDPQAQNVVFDARSADPSLWTSDSVIYGSGPKLAGSLHWTQGVDGSRWSIHRLTEGVRDSFWNPMTQTSHGVNRQNRYSQVQEAGKLMPTRKFTLQSGKVSYLVRGSFRAFASIDSHRLIAGPLHGETLFENGGPDQEYRWVTHSLDRYKGKTVHIELSPLQDKAFAIVQIIDGMPPAVVPAASLDLAASIALWNDIRALAIQQQTGVDTTGWSEVDRAAVAQWLASLLESREYAYPASLTQEVLAQVAQAFEQLSATVADGRQYDQKLAAETPWHSQLALAMRDGSGINDALLIRGNHLRPGKEVPRRNLEALGGNPPSTDPISGSGRNRLASALLAPDNPLVARVVVNRLWHHLLGRGIVATTDDFGVLGARPTHPELLDHLAVLMVERRWSLKSMIREICLSSVYRQDTRPSALAKQIDPDNQWLSHARVRRLEAESLRDTLMAISDELDFRGTTPEVPSVPVHLTEFLEGRGRPGRNGPLDGGGKRSIYLEVRRNFLNPMMLTFDAPTPFSSMGRRNVSNVPAQSLILLNDPFVHQLADRWADKVLRVSDNDSDRIRWMWLKAFSREPTNQELELTQQFVKSSDFANPKDAYRSLAHMVMNNKETIYRF